MQPNNRVRSEFNTGTVVEIAKNGDPIIKWDGFAYDIPVPADVAKGFEVVS